MKKKDEKKKERKGDVIFNVPIHIKYYLTPIAILLSAIAITVIIILSK
jgi:hypothetical protein